MKFVSSIYNLLLLLVLHKCTGEYTCGSDWKLVEDMCVGVFTKTDQRATWHVARDRCLKQNSTLVTIRTSNKQSLIRSVFSGNAWIDLTRDSSSNQFRWGHGDPQVTTEMWQTSQPNNGGEGCAVLLSGSLRGFWADKACYSKYYYICESVSGTSGCPDKTVPLAGNCYLFSNSTKKWYEARQECQKSGGDLLVIENELKNEIIRAAMAKNRSLRYKTYWIGATDAQEEGKWKWLDRVEEMTYQNWTNGSPDNGANNIHSCVYMASTYRNSGAWKTANCKVFYPSVCEKKPIYNNGTTSCEDDWKLYSNLTCIGLNKNGSFWEEARKSCKRNGGDLVVITDSAKSSFVRRRLVNTMRSRSAWIGLHDKNLKAEWNWLDSNDKTTFRDWYNGYPRENLMRKLDCVFMRATKTSRGRWANSLCSRQIAYICEKTGGQCNTGWLRYGGSCYKFNFDISNWDDARGRCKLQDPQSDLVIIDNYNEQRWLQGQISDSAEAEGFWIALNSKKQKNSFVWFNMTALAAPYTNWDAGMPSYLKTEACVAATGSYRRAEWLDQDCGLKAGYLCEKPAEGDDSYYDFKYNSSIYKVLASQSFTPVHADEFCKKILGVNASLIYFEGTDEMTYIMRELHARGLAASKRYWTRGTVDNTAETLYTTPRPSSSSSTSSTYGSRTCLELYFTSYGPWQSRQYSPKLRLKPCCQETPIICEKHIDPSLKEDNKYDFSINTSIYRLMDEEKLTPDKANERCRKLLNNTARLAVFETWEELEAVSREVLARHTGEHFIYWVGGDALDGNSTSVHPNPKISLGSDDHCLTLEYDAKTKEAFDSTMTLKPTPCVGKKKYLCEEAGVKAAVDGVHNYLKEYAEDEEEYWKLFNAPGCVGPCIGLAVALPFVVIGTVLITAAYFWVFFIRRQSPYPVKFSKHEDDEERLTM